ncbi:MAG: hypothetical protein WCQ21_01215 [Verrucomicrobiota bacterium]
MKRPTALVLFWERPQSFQVGSFSVFASRYPNAGNGNLIGQNTVPPFDISFPPSPTLPVPWTGPHSKGGNFCFPDGHVEPKAWGQTTNTMFYEP